MKKILLSSIVAFGLIACGGSSGNSSKDNSTDKATQQKKENIEKTKEEPSNKKDDKKTETTKKIQNEDEFKDNWNILIEEDESKNELYVGIKSKKIESSPKSSSYTVGSNFFVGCKKKDNYFDDFFIFFRFDSLNLENEEFLFGTENPSYYINTNIKIGEEKINVDLVNPNAFTLGTGYLHLSNEKNYVLEKIKTSKILSLDLDWYGEEKPVHFEYDLRGINKMIDKAFKKCGY